MSERQDPTSLAIALGDLVAWLKAEDVPGMIIGGVATSLLARPRLTYDVDVLVWLAEERWTEFLSGAGRFGFAPRLSEAEDFARRSRMLLVRHEASGIPVDISFGALPFERDAVSRAKDAEIGGIRIPLPEPEDLVVMKAVAHRPQDLADIQSVLEVHPHLDAERVVRTVREFADALEMPEIMRDLEALLERGGAAST